MKVFRNYFKIVNKHKFVLGIYFIIFLVTVILIGQSVQKESAQFESYRPSIYFKNESNSLKAKKVEEVLSEYTEFNAEVEEETAEDELFYQMISAIVVIPKDFENNEEVVLKIAPNSMTGFLVSQTVDNYLNKVKGYEVSGFEEERALELAKEDIKKEVEIGYLESKKEKDYGIRSYFNMINYTIMAQVILVVTMLMAIYNKKEIADRNNVSPLSNTRFTIEVTLGHLVISLLIWLSYIVIFVVMWPDALELETTRMMILNSFVFTMVIVSLAVLISTLVKGEGAIHVIVNTLSLGASFLSGAFVPQEFLSESVLNISKIFPSYYYVRNNSLIEGGLGDREITQNIIIMLAFMFLFIVANILLKSRKKKMVG